MWLPDVQALSWPCSTLRIKVISVGPVAEAARDGQVAASKRNNKSSLLLAQLEVKPWLDAEQRNFGAARPSVWCVSIICVPQSQRDRACVKICVALQVSSSSSAYHASEAKCYS